MKSKQLLAVILTVAMLTACDISVPAESAYTQEQIDEIQAEKDSLQEALDSLQSEKDILQSEYENLQTEAEDLKEDIEALRFENGTLQIEIDELAVDDEVSERSPAPVSSSAASNPAASSNAAPSSAANSSASSNPVSSSSSAPTANTSTTSTTGRSGALVGIGSVKVNDTTTLATDVSGQGYSPTSYTFYSSSNKVLGTISASDYDNVIKSNMTQTNGEWGMPGGAEQGPWLCAQFNLYRGLSGTVPGGGSTSGGGGNSSSSLAVFNADAAASEVVSLANKEREKVGLPALAIDNRMMELANMRAEELYTLFSHTRPNGGSMAQSHNYLENAHYGSANASDAMNSWMNSKGHRETILSDYISYIGVGVYRAPNGNTYWIQLFGLSDEYAQPDAYPDAYPDAR